MRLNVLLFAGLLGTAVAGVQFATDYSRALRSEDQIRRTPAVQTLSLDQTGGSVEIFLSDEPLQDHLARSSLTVLRRDGLAEFVAPEHFKVRLSNPDPVQAPSFHAAVYSAFALGISLTCLLLGLVDFFKKPSRRPTGDERGRSLGR